MRNIYCALYTVQLQHLHIEIVLCQNFRNNAFIFRQITERQLVTRSLD